MNHKQYFTFSHPLDTTDINDILSSLTKPTAFLQQQHKMSKGKGSKGKEIATEHDWKEKLAMLDQQLGWDEEAVSDWADDCDAENQQSTGGGNNNAVQNFPESFDETALPEMQKLIWDAAVDESRCSGAEHASNSRKGLSTHSTFDNQEQGGAALPQPTKDHDEWEAEEEQREEERDGEGDDEEEIEPKSELAAYLYHRFGFDIRYENRCTCCEFLVDNREERRKRDREYFAQAGGSSLMRDTCVLLPIMQEDLPGTQDVDKPVLMVTTPEGDTLYPHDLEEYPEPAAASDDGTLGDLDGAWRPIPGESEYLVTYEEEDTRDN